MQINTECNLFDIYLFVLDRNNKGVCSRLSHFPLDRTETLGGQTRSGHFGRSSPPTLGQHAQALLYPYWLWKWNCCKHFSIHFEHFPQFDQAWYSLRQSGRKTTPAWKQEIDSICVFVLPPPTPLGPILVERVRSTCTANSSDRVENDKFKDHFFSSSQVVSLCAISLFKEHFPWESRSRWLYQFPFRIACLS